MGRTLEKLLLATPRGYCAGVDRAVQTVERALDLYGPPVYVRKEIVHNKHVVDQLRDRGAVFVDSVTEVPEGSTVMVDAPAEQQPEAEETAAPEAEVKLTVIEPKPKPTPVGVGAEGGSSSEQDSPDEEPQVPDAPPQDGE